MKISQLNMVINEISNNADNLDVLKEEENQRNEKMKKNQEEV